MHKLGNIPPRKPKQPLPGLNNQCPPIIQIKLRIRTRQIEPILRIPGSIALRQNALLLTRLEVRMRDTFQILQFVRRFDDGGREAGFDVEFDVAVEELHAGVVGFVAQDEIAFGVHLYCVAADGGVRWVDGGRLVGRCFGGARDDLEVVAVETGIVS